MPNYKFLLHTPENKPPFQEWEFIPAISEDDISGIEDSLVASTSSKVGTSIPTPLARLFTFKTAFYIVNKQINAGDDIEVVRESVYGTIVSDCLDLLEWIFVHGMDSFERITVDLDADNKFGTSDNLIALSKAFNSTIKNYFNSALHITLFRHKASGVVIGGSSPYSLVYTSPNLRKAMHKMGLHQLRGLGTDTFFDNSNCLLHKRDVKFISYLYDIVKPIIENGENSDPLRSFADYVKTTISKFNIKPVQFESSEIVKLNPSDHFPFVLKRLKIEEEELIKSDFYLDKTLRYVEQNKKPLVLSSTSDLRGQYVNGRPWNKEGIIEFNRPYNSDINRRKLPDSGLTTEYPFIIDSDLFQANLIEISYDINDAFFHTIQSQKYGTRFLLPLKPLFFEIVGLDNLVIEDHVTVSETGNIITMVLRVPVIGSDPAYLDRRNVEFRKEYNIDIHDKNNDIKSYPFELAFFPFFRKADTVGYNDHKKTILWFERTNAENKCTSIVFYNNEMSVIGNKTTFNPLNGRSNGEPQEVMPGSFPLTPYNRMNYDELSYYTRYFSTTDDYRVIEVRIDNGTSGLIIPRFITVMGPLNKKFKYAIDFGTTNTHIEYAEQNALGIIEATKSPFRVEISGDVPGNRKQDKPLVVLLHKNSNVLGDMDKMHPILLREFLPSSIGNDGNSYNIKFPTRSVMVDFDPPKNESDVAFLHSNIAFKVGEKNDFHASAVYTPDLKWLLENAGIVKQDAYVHRVRIFFEQIFYMIKYKAIMDNCDENSLTLCFTRPMSMKDKPINTLLQAQIRVAIKKVFPKTNSQDINKYIFDLDESLAPFENDKSAFGTAHFCNIDIGGGTTDILFGYRPDLIGDFRFYISSIRFAGNNLWGNDVNPKMHNGIIQYFASIAEAKSGTLGSDHPYSIAYREFMEYHEKGFSDSELVSVLFKNNKTLKFTESVFSGCVDFKLLPFIHYAAILYFVTVVFKKYPGLGFPITVSLSGNGSLYLNLLDAGSITKLLLRKFSGEANFFEDFKKVDNPKEITARGALHMQPIEPLVAATDTFDSYDEEVAEICTPIDEHVMSSDNVNTGKMIADLSESLNTFFTTLLPIVKTNNKLKADIGDIGKYEDLFTKSNYSRSINRWLSNERPDLKNIDSVFFKPIKYILFDLSIAIYEKNKID